MNKKNLLLAIVLFFSISVFSQHNLRYMRLGAGSYYVTEIDNIGFTVNGVYEFLDYWEFAGKLTYIPEKNLEQWNLIDFDAHYVFYEQSKKMKLYALAGMNANIKTTTIPEFRIGAADIEPESKKITVPFAANFGAGINFKLSKKFTLNPELRISFREEPFFRFGMTAQFNLK